SSSAGGLPGRAREVSTVTSMPPLASARTSASRRNAAAAGSGANRRETTTACFTGPSLARPRPPRGDSREQRAARGGRLQDPLGDLERREPLSHRHGPVALAEHRVAERLELAAQRLTLGERVADHVALRDPTERRDRVPLGAHRAVRVEG